MDFNKIKSYKGSIVENIRNDTADADLNGVAIIGIHARIGSAENLNEFWDALCSGCDMIRDFPSPRWEDANKLYNLKAGSDMSEESGQAAYLERIDNFDAAFFGIANTEADLMDPAQRLFLESAFAALEDSGYSSVHLDASKTGVYVGYNSQAGQYSDAIVKTPDNFGISVSGNISSILASRISYFMNLKGPAMIIDTACSSSLTALHIACEQLRSGEVDMAIAGSASISLVPRQPNKSKLGIESSSQRTKTFDDTADGTGGGEGVICIILKPLAQAMEDRDNIYAVIKGSSINQDGASVGITAPNAAAQEEVITAAWEDANVDPETISYIEAHGTATNLGDPVEITGVERAFGRYTDKKQFCAIGSVKSNAGHLDCAAGLAGVVKAVLMLKHKKIPPLVHFSQPNKKIDFIDSPVYVNDRLIEWETDNTPRRCGISSFGLSGTNCHVILEEAPNITVKEKGHTYKLLTVSAKNEKIVGTYLENYKDFLALNSEADPDDFCYTANVGRMHHSCRLAVIFNEPGDVIKLDISGQDNPWVFYGRHKIADGIKGEGYLSNAEKIKITQQADAVLDILTKTSLEDEMYLRHLSELAELYVRGADINWRRFYHDEERRRMSIPTYPYNRDRHWIRIQDKSIETANARSMNKLHPLMDACIADSYKLKIYETRMNLNAHWELSEHRVNGKGVLPGTAFIEMAYFACKRYYQNNPFEMRDLIYLSPLACDEKESKLVHTVIKENGSGLDIAFYSKSESENIIEDQWLCNAEVKIIKCEKPKERYIDINAIIERCKETRSEIQKSATIVNIGGIHWKDNLSHIYANQEELVLELSVSPILREEALNYYMLPSVLDQALSSGNYFSKSVYIPYCFSKAHFYDKLPVRLFSHIKKRHDGNEDDELAVFDITLCDENGKCIGEVENYAIKKIHQPEFFLVTQRLASNMFMDTAWVEIPDADKTSSELISDDEVLLVLFRDNAQQLDWVNELRIRYRFKAIMVEAGQESFVKRTDSDYCIGYNQEDFNMLIKQLDGVKIKHIINLTGYTGHSPDTIDDLKKEVALTLKTTYLLIRAILNSFIRYEIKVSFITYNGIAVTGNEDSINPVSRALTGMGLSINDEYRNIITRAFDCDHSIALDDILDEISANQKTYAVAYRQRKRYVEHLQSMGYSEEIFKKPFVLRDNGVYVIAGGMGGMGISFAKYFTNINPSIKVILLNRSYSDEELGDKDFEMDDKTRSKLDVISKLRSTGKTIDIVKADISEHELLSAQIEGIRAKYGKIDGVINAAGVASNGFLMNRTWEQFESVVNPKIYGSWLLFQLTKNDNPDFFILCSSLASVFGSPGQIDYVAANAYLDSFAYYCRRCGSNGIAIDWTGWNESGMAVDNNVHSKDSLLCFVNDAEGAVALAYSIKTEKPRILVGEINYSIFATQRERFDGKVIFQDNIEEKLSAFSSIDPNEIKFNDIVISGKSIERLSAVEKDVILVWARVLGIKEIDIHDKFFESGGNSLLAATFQKELDKKYQGAMSITDIFTCSSVEKISEFITNKINEASVKLSIEDIIENDADEEENQEDIEELIQQFVNKEISLDKIDGLLS